MGDGEPGGSFSFASDGRVWLAVCGSGLYISMSCGTADERIMGAWVKEGYPDFKLQFNTATTGQGHWQLFSWCPHGPVPFDYTKDAITIDFPKWGRHDYRYDVEK